MASLTFTMTGAVNALITVTEVNDDLVFEVHLMGGSTVGDIRALYFDVNNEALLSGLSVAGSNVTSSLFSANNVKTVGGDTNVNGQVINTFGAFDAGVQIGTAGIGADDIRSTQFVLSHSTMDLTLDFISQQDFAVRINSVGTQGGQRTDGLKLGGESGYALNALDDTAQTNENSVVTGNVLSNDLTGGFGSSVIGVSGGAVGSAFAVTSHGGRHGQLLISADGSFIFDPQLGFDDLGAGGTDTVTISYTSRNSQGGDDTATLTITIQGSNDAAIITGTASGEIVEDAEPNTVSGDLDLTDADNPADAFQEVSEPQSSDGGYGTFTATADGVWTYTLDNTNPEVDALDASSVPLTDTFTVYAQDGTAQVVTITIVGGADGPTVSTGVAIDGYIAGATVFADANANSVLDEGEAFTTTDASGAYTLVGGEGNLVLQGGTDISTGLSFSGQLTALAGSSVITPLTTLVVAVFEITGDPVEAEDLVKTVLGLGGLTASLGAYDPISATLSADAFGADAVTAAIMLQNTITQTAALLSGAGASEDEAQAAALAAIAEIINANPTTLDLTQTATLESIITAAADATATSLSMEVVEGAASIVQSTNQVAVDANAAGGDPLELLTTLAQVQIVVESEIAAALSDAGQTGDVTDAVGDFTGTALDDAVDAAADDVGDVDGATVGDGNANTLVGGAGADVITGEGGDDTLRGQGGADTLVGGTGNDTLEGGAGVDTYIWSQGDGFDTVVATGGGANEDIIQINGTFYDYNWEVQGNDLLIGVTADDSYTFSSVGGALRLPNFFAGTETINYLEVDLGSEFNQFYNPSGGLSRIYFSHSSGTDQGVYYEVMIGSSASDSMTGGGGDFDKFWGLDGNDTISVSNGTIGHMRGGRGDDTLTGADQNDHLVGGSGDDTMDGGTGYDQVTYNHFWLVDTPLAQGVFVNLSGVEQTRIVNGTSVTLQTGQAQDNWGDIDTLLNIEEVRGSNNNDTLVGSDNADVLKGLGGIDTLEGGGGDDLLVGNAGDDILQGGAGADTYVWSQGDGFDTVVATGGGANEDIVRINGTFYDYNWTVEGNDILIGVAVDGNYDFNDAGGAIRLKDFRLGIDTISYFEADLGESNQFYSPDGGPARIYYNFVSGVDQGNYQETMVGSDSADTMTGGGGYSDWFYGLGGDDVITISNGTFGGVRAGTGDDTITGGNFDDNLGGGAGDDTIDGGDGLDMVIYNRAGDGSTLPTAGVLVNLSSQEVTRDLNGGSVTVGASQARDNWGDTDSLVSIEIVRGSNFDDVIIGSDEDNVLRGLAGDDTLQGGAGVDSYVWSQGDGFDTVVAADGGANEDIIQINGTFYDYNWEIDGNDLLIGVTADDSYTFSSVGGALRLQNFFTGSDTINYLEADFGPEFNQFYNPNGGLSRIHFSLSSGTNQGDYYEVMIGSSASDSMTGGGGYLDKFWGLDGNDTMSVSNGTIGQMRGGRGNDTLTGADQNDQLVGGSGNDAMDGGTGYDVVTYNHFYTNDTPLAQGVFVNLSGAAQTRTVNGDSITLQAGQAQDNWGDTDTLLNIEEVRGSNNNDTLVGSDNADVLKGLGGFDTLEGGDGNDYLQGGADDDVLIGASGADTFDISTGAGTGIDTIEDFTDGEDVLDLVGFGFTNADDALQYFTENLADVVFSFNGATVILQNFSLANLDASDLTGFSAPGGIIGTEDPDELFGTSQDDTIEGLGGDDILHGEGGNDYLIGGEGSDTIDGGEGEDDKLGLDFDGSYDVVFTAPGEGFVQTGAGAIDVFTGIEAIWGTDDNEFIGLSAGPGMLTMTGYGELVTVVFTAGGDDQVFGSDEAELFSGGDGNDVIAAGGGNDDLGGEAGDDILIGGAGDDVISGWDGSDEIDGGEGSGDILESRNVEAGGAIITVTGVGMGHVTFVNTADQDTFVNIEHIWGSDESDIIDLGGGLSPDTWVDGRFGNDIIIGSANNEQFSGGAGSDTLTGGLGSDIFDVSSSYESGDVDTITDFTQGFDVIDLVGFGFGDAAEALGYFEQNGDDVTFTYNGATVIISNFILADLTANDLIGFPDPNEFIGTDDPDTIDGNDNDNRILGLGGGDTLNGGDGADVIEGGDGDDTIDGGASEGDTLQLDRTGGVTVHFTSPGGGTAAYTGGEVDTFFNIEQIFGTGENDVINLIADPGTTTNTPWGLVMPNVHGWDGDDQISGSALDDVIIGWDGNDTISGAGGNDSLEGVLGSDTIDGGDGSADTVHLDLSGTIVITLTAPGGGTIAYANGDVDTISNIENISGTSEADIVSIIAEPGMETSTPYGPKLPNLYGWEGDDQLTGSEASDVLLGGSGGDTLSGGDGDDVLSDGEGSDTMDGGVGFDTFFGASTFGLDIQVTSPGAGTSTNVIGDFDTFINIEQIYGTDLNDTINLGAGVSAIAFVDAFDGSDQVFGSASAEGLAGGGGDDVIQGGGGNDTINGVVGTDTLALDQVTGTVVTLNGAGNGTVSYSNGDTDSFLNIDQIRGSAFADTINLAAGTGISRVEGLAGDDNITGGSDAEVLVGGAGNDTLKGGGGTDVFDVGFDWQAGDSDTIVDFTDNQDRLDLSAFDFIDAADALLHFTDIGADVQFSHNGVIVTIQGFTVGNISETDLIL